MRPERSINQALVQRQACRACKEDYQKTTPQHCQGKSREHVVAALAVPAQCQTRPFSSRRTLLEDHDSSPLHHCAQEEDSWTSGNLLACSTTCLQGVQSSHASQ